MVNTTVILTLILNRPQRRAREQLSPRRSCLPSPYCGHASELTPRNSEPSSSAINATAAQLFITYCNYQPLPLFNEDGFVERINGRDRELLLAIQAVSLRFRRRNGDGETTIDTRECARKSRSLVMDRVGESKIELSTLQSLCLLAMFDFTGKRPMSPNA